MSLIDGVCCEYCRKRESADCPVQAASPWSRWEAFCYAYEPDPEEGEAKEVLFISKEKGGKT